MRHRGANFGSNSPFIEIKEQNLLVPVVDQQPNTLLSPKNYSSSGSSNLNNAVFKYSPKNSSNSDNKENAENSGDSIVTPPSKTKG